MYTIEFFKFDWGETTRVNSNRGGAIQNKTCVANHVIK